MRRWKESERLLLHLRRAWGADGVYMCFSSSPSIGMSLVCSYTPLLSFGFCLPETIENVSSLLIARATVSPFGSNGISVRAISVPWLMNLYGSTL
jgi:hypothetical protein